MVSFGEIHAFGQNAMRLSCILDMVFGREEPIYFVCDAFAASTAVSLCGHRRRVSRLGIGKQVISFCEVCTIGPGSNDELW